MRLPGAAAAVENLVVDGLEGSGDARVDEGVAKLLGLARLGALRAELSPRLMGDSPAIAAESRWSPGYRPKLVRV